jgi:hypothetical protein
VPDALSVFATDFQFWNKIKYIWSSVLAWAAASSLEDWQGHHIEVFLYLIYTVFLANPGYCYFLQMKL